MSALAVVSWLVFLTTGLLFFRTVLADAFPTWVGRVYIDCLTLPGSNTSSYAIVQLFEVPTKERREVIDRELMRMYGIKE